MTLLPDLLRATQWRHLPSDLWNKYCPDEQISGFAAMVFDVQALGYAAKELRLREADKPGAAVHSDDYCTRRGRDAYAIHLRKHKKKPKT